MPTRQPTPLDLAAATALLSEAERSIALLTRCRPLNAESELRRLLGSFERDDRGHPRFEYAPAPDLSGLRKALNALLQYFSGPAPLAHLYGQRASELEREARVVEAIGHPTFARRARDRFVEPDRQDAEGALALARRWSTLAREAAVPTVASDAERHPESLVSLMRAEVGRQRLPFRVLLTSQLQSLAATGDGVIWIRRREPLSATRARRVVVHEVWAHAMPRARARRQRLGLYRVGSEWAAEDEEGRALLLEERHDLSSNARRRELALRHLGSLALRAGASFAECVRELAATGASTAEAVRLGCRLSRGGGLCREVVYLPALLRVRRELREQPHLEDFMQRGRIGVRAARVLCSLLPAEPTEP